MVGCRLVLGFVRTGSGLIRKADGGKNLVCAAVLAKVKMSPMTMTLLGQFGPFWGLGAQI